MKSSRLLLLATSLILSVALAFVARDLVYDLIVVPISYLIWQLVVIMRAVPELVRWIVLIVVLGLIVALQLVPDLKRRSTPISQKRAVVGQVEGAATWLMRARNSNYFKWQLAHRLAGVSHQLRDVLGAERGADTPDSRVADYLDAGLNRSFVDFPAPRRIFPRPVTSVLDVDPGRVVDYLEAHSLLPGGDHEPGS